MRQRVLTTVTGLAAGASLGALCALAFASAVGELLPLFVFVGLLFGGCSGTVAGAVLSVGPGRAERNFAPKTSREFPRWK